MGNRQKQQQAQTQHPDVATQLFNAQQQQALTTQQLQQQALQQQREGTGAVQTGSGNQIVSTSRGYSVINPFLMANVDPYAIDRAARLHRNAAGMILFGCCWWA